MPAKLGLDAKLYYCVAGIGGTPTWVELTNVKNVNLNLQKGLADVTTRGSGGWKALKGTVKEASVEWEMVWDPADAGFAAVRDAFLADTLLGMAVMDGPIATAGSQGLWADCMISDFSRDEPLEEAISVKVAAKPTYSTNPPQWKVVPTPPGP